MKRIHFAIVLSLALGAAVASPARAAGPNTIELASSTIHLGDVVPTAPADLAGLDLGPAPAPGGSRILAQSDILRLVPADRRAAVAAPAAVRIVRKTQRLDATAIDALTRNALKSSGLPRGATLSAVRAPAALVVPAGYDRVVATMAKPPRRQGPFETTVALDLYGGPEVVAHLTVPVQLVLGPEAAVADVPAGSLLSLVVRRGLVEVSSSATASTGGDVGDVVQVVVRDTGKSLRAQLVAKDRAVAVEAP